MGVKCNQYSSVEGGYKHHRPAKTAVCRLCLKRIHLARFTCQFFASINRFHVCKFMFRQLFGGRATYRVSVIIMV